MKIHLPYTSIMLNVQDAVQAICQYMFDELEFNYFDYGRYYDDGKTFHLSNDPKNDGQGKNWIWHYYASGVCITSDEIEEIRQRYNHAQELIGFLTDEIAVTDCLLSHLKHREQINIAKSFGINQRVYYLIRQKHYVEIIGFGSSYKDNFHSFCMQNLSIFRGFITHFRTEAKNIIDAAEKEALYLPPLSKKNAFLFPSNFFWIRFCEQTKNQFIFIFSRNFLSHQISMWKNF